MRLRADDIKFLFDNVPVGTRVQFINEPIKVSVEPDGSRYLEVHNPLSANEEELKSKDPVPLTLSASVGKVAMDPAVNQSEVDAAIKARSGMPVKVN
ncbi:putative L,D-transpeptidase YbiS precursor [compost metagenome]